jgi:hypothetical protein
MCQDIVAREPVVDVCPKHPMQFRQLAHNLAQILYPGFGVDDPEGRLPQLTRAVPE